MGYEFTQEGASKMPLIPQGDGKFTYDFTQEAMELPLALTVKQVIEQSGLSKSSVYRAIDAKQLLAMKKFGKTIIPRGSFIEWMNSFEPLADKGQRHSNITPVNQAD